jgi:hypothetical protein
MTYKSSRKIGVPHVLLMVLVLALLFELLTNPALAEYKSGIRITSWITGSANTYGDPGQTCQGGSGGTAYSYQTSSSVIYKNQVWLREWSTKDYIHLLNQMSDLRYYNTVAGTVYTPWNNCSWEYVTSWHAYLYSISSSWVYAYTSGRGTSSSTYCWNGGYCY